MSKEATGFTPDIIGLTPKPTEWELSEPSNPGPPAIEARIPQHYAEGWTRVPTREEPPAPAPPKGWGQTIYEGLQKGIEQQGAGGSAFIGSSPERIGEQFADTHQFKDTQEDIDFAKRGQAAKDAMNARLPELIDNHEKAMAGDDVGARRKAAAELIAHVAVSTGAIAKNMWDSPKQAVGKLAESLGSSIPAYGGATGGALAGGMIAGPGGAIIGGLVGYLAGNMTTNTQSEMYDKIESDLQAKGVDTSKAANVAKALTDSPSIIADARPYALKRGAATTAAEGVVDAATFGAGKFLKPAKGLFGTAVRAGGVMAGQGVGEGAGAVAADVAVGKPVDVADAIEQGIYGAASGAPEGAGHFIAGKHLRGNEPGAPPPGPGTDLTTREQPQPADWELVDDGAPRPSAHDANPGAPRLPAPQEPIVATDGRPFMLEATAKRKANEVGGEVIRVGNGYGVQRAEPDIPDGLRAEHPDLQRGAPVAGTPGESAPGAVSPVTGGTVAAGNQSVQPLDSANPANPALGVPSEQARSDQTGSQDVSQAPGSQAQTGTGGNPPGGQRIDGTNPSGPASSAGLGHVASVDAAAHEAATSPISPRAEPTDAQKEAGNYPKGHLKIAGLDIAIENPAGSHRRPEWPMLQSHYGYINRTVGADHEHVDTFVAQGTPEDFNGHVFVVNQTNRAGGFDEHKVMIGYHSIEQADRAYHENYTKGWNGGKSVTSLSMPEFKRWLKDGNTKAPVEPSPIRQHIERTLAPKMERAGVNLHVVEHASDLPNPAHHEAAANAEGFFDPETRSVALIHGNIKTKERADWVAAHEWLGHYGLSALGSTVEARLEDLAKTKTGAALVEAVKASRPEDHLTTAEAAEEAASELAAALETGNWQHLTDRYGVDVTSLARVGLRGWLNKLIDAIKAALSKVAGLKFDTTQIHELLRDMHRAATKGSTERREPTMPKRSEAAPTFYSELARRINGMNVNVAPASGWKQQIAALTKQGVKPDEIEFSGINDWLDMQPGKITKEAVLEFLRGNGVRVTETVLGANKPGIEIDEMLDKWAEGEPKDNPTAESIRTGGSWFETRRIAMKNGDADVLRMLDSANGEPTKYEGYTLPGGKNQRELLITLPDSWDEEESRASQAVDAARNAHRESISTNAPKQEQDRLKAAFDKAHAAWEKITENDKAFKDPHWDQPNIVVHVRFNERTDAQGNRVLFIEEVQSGWAQTGKKQGFAEKKPTGPPPVSKAVPWAEFEDNMREVAARKMAETSGLPLEVTKRAVSGLPLLSIAKHAGMDDEFLANDKAHEDYRQALNEYRDANKPGVPNGPFVGKTDAWVALAVKRMIRWAVDHGIDKIAFVNGEQSAERYDLSKKIATVQFLDRPQGADKEPSHGLLIARDHNGHRVINQMMDPEEVEKYVGKDVARKLFESDTKLVKEKGAAYRGRELSGIDLKVGGEGMKAFYDKIVPNVVNDVLKKLGGGRVEPIHFSKPTPGEYYFDSKYPGFSVRTNDGVLREDGTVGSGPGAVFKTKEEAREALMKSPGTTQQLGFTISPALKQKAQAGLPLFSKPPTSVERAEAKLKMSRRPADFTNPEDRVEVSTTRPSQKAGRTDNSYDQKWVIDASDVKAKAHLNAIRDALKSYNTLSGKGNASQLIAELHQKVVDNLLWLHDLVPADIRARAKLWYDGAHRIAGDWGKRYGITTRQASAVLAVYSPQMDWFKNVSLGDRTLEIWKNRATLTWTPEMTAWVKSWVNASTDVETKDKRRAQLAQMAKLEGKTLAALPLRDAAYFVRVFDETYHERSYRLVTPEGGFSNYSTNSDDGDASVTWGGFRSIEKALSILQDGSFKNIDEKLGDEHKVRNFFNNIVSPNSADGHVTIDTHAIGAALVKAVSGTAREVMDNFGRGAGRSPETGSGGTYGIVADAYRDAASQRHLLPREMQSITWEAIRAMFPAAIKDQLTPLVDAVHARVKRGEITQEQARKEILDLAGGLRKFAWEGGDSGVPASMGGASFNLTVQPARTLAPKTARDKISIGLSASTGSIPGIGSLQQKAAAGDLMAHKLLQEIATDSLRYLLGDTSAKIVPAGATGLYGGSMESSVSATISFDEEDRAKVLAALAKFADNFNQEQVHVRQSTKAKAGTKFSDGSYATPSHRWELKAALTRKQVERVIAESGLYGLTFGDDFVEAYLVGDVENETVRSDFNAAIGRADGAIGARAKSFGSQVDRLWPYGHGDEAIGYDHIAGVVPTGSGIQQATARRVAEYLAGQKVKPSAPAEITPQQRAKQEGIARDYEALPDNALDKPAPKRAYAALAREVTRQFDALPIKVEVYTGTGEPYANSAAMRRDIADNNHLSIFGTEPGTFGPEGSDFTGHPLLEDSGRKDANGRPLLVNDLLRAVHDYYAHNISAVQFGPKGEEAAWKNHMAMTPDPWARWALTAETRGQNSWVNFSPGATGKVFARQKAALLPVEHSLTGDRAIDVPMKAFIEGLNPRQKQGSLPTSVERAEAKLKLSRAPKTPQQRQDDALKSRRARAFGSLNPAQQQAILNVGGIPIKATIGERIDALKANLSVTLRQGLVDQFAAIKDLDQAAYIEARLSKGSDGTLEAIMIYGAPFMNNGVPDVNVNGKGFIESLAALKGEHDRAILWVAAQRADRLLPLGLERLFKLPDIRALLTLNQGDFDHGGNRYSAYRDFLTDLNKINDAVVGISVESGLSDPAARQAFLNVPYVPFYRVMDNKSGGARFSSGLINQEDWKRLKGGTQMLKSDLLANVIQNWAHLLAASARNRAAIAAVTAAERAGVAYQVPSGTKGAIRYYENGVAKYYAVEDPFLMEAISALEYAPGPLLKALSVPKRWLTTGVTANPAFKLRNLIRDSLQSAATTEISLNIPKNIIQGIAHSGKSSQDFASMLAGGGVIRFGSMLEGDSAARTRQMIKRAKGGILLDESGWQKMTGLASKLWHAYSELGDRGENVNRVALYHQMMKPGPNQATRAEALFAARDMMDFTMMGRWPVIRGLAQTVSFFNARLQGMYKLGKSARENKARFFGVTMAIALASVALMAWQKDDPDWQKIDDYDRDNYWWFKIGKVWFKIPKPFEVGAIGTLAERGMERIIDSKEMDNKRLAARLGFMISQTFAMNPTPQAIKPWVDLYANKDSFTGRAIEPDAIKAERPKDRATPLTTEGAILLGQLGIPNPFEGVKGNYEPLSPVQLDFLLKGYLGWVGTSIAAAFDWAIRPAMDRGARPAMSLKDTFFLGNFLETIPTNNSRYVTKFYDQAKATEEAYQSFMSAVRKGDQAGADKVKAEEGDNIMRGKMATAQARALGKSMGEIKAIQADKNLTADEKRMKIDAATQRRNELAERFTKTAN